jgi:L-amino acid N-acyltransferase YncA
MTAPKALIRSSTEADLPAITAIYAHHVRTSACTFELTPPAEAEMTTRRDDVLAKGLPYLVLEVNDGSGSRVAGYAYANWFKPRPAYRFSAENSIYLAHDCVGHGLGTALLAELCARCERAGLRKLIAIIGECSNVASIRAHERNGFSHVGVIAGAGWKFDAWREIVLMEKTLGCGIATAPHDPSQATPASPAK